MAFYTPLAWRQLAHEKLRLAAAIAGISFAVTLMLMQLGFMDALYVSSTLLHRSFDGELVIVSAHYDYVLSTQRIPDRRLYQTLVDNEVEGIAPLYWAVAIWKNHETFRHFSIIVIGMDPERNGLLLPGLATKLQELRLPDTMLFDSGSRPEFGPVVRDFESGREIVTELQQRDTKLIGLTRLGTSFVADGNVIVSELNFLRLFPNRERGAIDAGVVKLKPRADVRAVQARLAARMPADVQVLTKNEFIELEMKHWRNSTPIGFVFLLGTVVGFIVGAVTAYQILYTDVASHLTEYATLKAMGYTDGALGRVVVEQAIILSVLGYVPGFVVAVVLYALTVHFTALPIYMTWQRGTTVFGLSVLMSVMSALFSLRKVRQADPADVF
jgi:putative ABC transport system permease protein